MRRQFCAMAVLAILAAAGAAQAATFRWANDRDVASMDPYARQETFQLSFDSNIYEPLVRRDKDLKLEPALATRWSQYGPETWRFTLRRGVRFQDGSPFTADDVVFSYARVTAPRSALASSLAGVKQVKKIDDYTVDFITDGPDPILPEEITAWDIMSKSWCEKHDATRIADLADDEENYATGHANGTGPFILREREPGTETILVRNPSWWDKPQHNLDEAVFRPMPDAEARLAALAAGTLDMIYAVPPQDVDLIARTPHLKLIQSPELRTIFLGFDLSRRELLESSVKGRNPFQDLRVRQAFYQAIDEETIATKVMRGFARPSGLMVAPGVYGFDPAMNGRLLPYDPAAARRLLAEAGYPDGFEVGMDCPSDRYINDEGICTEAAAMLAKVGITVKPLIQRRAKFFAKIMGPDYDTSFFLLGWTPITYDAHNMLVNLVATRSGRGRGDYNAGGYSNPELDTLIDQIQGETDPERRLAELHQALSIVKTDIPVIPLHQQMLVWAARDNIELVQPADNYLPLRYVRVK